MRKSWAYILTNNHHTTLYIGVTSELHKRVWKHKTHFYEKAFSAKYNVHKLVYYETFDSIVKAIRREKVLKRKPRAYKVDLINGFNREWRDLYDDTG